MKELVADRTKVLTPSLTLAIDAKAKQMKAAGVYFVKPSASALAQASLMCCGVSKSGSPAPKPTTSMPSAFICLALESLANVSDGAREAARREIL